MSGRKWWKARSVRLSVSFFSFPFRVAKRNIDRAARQQEIEIRAEVSYRFNDGSGDRVMRSTRLYGTSSKAPGVLLEARHRLGGRSNG